MMMKLCKRMIVLLALTIPVVGCSNDYSYNSGDPRPDSFTLELTAIELTNTDSGAVLEVDGLPAVGNTLSRQQ